MSLRASATVRPSPCALCMRVWLGLSFFLNLSSSTAPPSLSFYVRVSRSLSLTLSSPHSLSFLDVASLFHCRSARPQRSDLIRICVY